jgi:hypothetical protein
LDDRKLVVSKVSAARRQLDSAIELWFLDKDEVCIQTLAAAAYQIIHDINQKKGGTRDLLYDSAVIKDEYRSMWVAIIKKPVNFFKHANNDAEEIIEFSPFSSLLFMIFCFLGLKAIGEQTNDVEDTLITWIAVNEPNLVTEGYRELLSETLSVAGLADLRSIPKSEFFKTCLRARAELRAKRFP